MSMQKNQFINLMEECNLKDFLAHPKNMRQLKYFLNTFINLPLSFDLNKIEVIYQTIINHYTEPENLSTSDLILKSNRGVVIIKTYTTFKNEYIIHIMYNKLDQEKGKLRELRFKSDSKEEDIVVDYHLRSEEAPNCDIFKDVLQVKTIDLNRVNELSFDTEENRWLKFIAAKNKMEQKKVMQEDEILCDAYI